MFSFTALVVSYVYFYVSALRADCPVVPRVYYWLDVGGELDAQEES